MESLTFISLIPLLVLLLDPLISFLPVPTPSSATDLHLPPHVYCSNGTVTKEMQKQKKRETDRRYRKNKKVNASRLTSTAHHEVKKSKERKESSSLCELFWLMLCIISQWKLTFQLCYLYSLFSSPPPTYSFSFIIQAESSARNREQAGHDHHWKWKPEEHCRKIPSRNIPSYKPAKIDLPKGNFFFFCLINKELSPCINPAASLF